MQDDKITPNYWGALPAEVRYSKKLIPAAKVLYAEIMSLCLSQGFCWATNQYFADLYKVDGKTISKWASQLVKAGFIRVEIMNMFQRKIFPLVGVGIVPPHRQKAVPPPRNSSTPTAKKEPKEENKEEKRKDIAPTSSDAFSLKEEIKKMEDNPRREMNLIGFYAEERKGTLKSKITSKSQLSAFIKRHLQAAGRLKVFTDDQIVKATDAVKVKFREIDWTLDTVLKELTK